MQGPTDEDRFAAALRELTDLHATAAGLVACGEEAERAFADGLRIGDRVRRAVRQGHRDRPDAADAESVLAIARRLESRLRACLDGPEVARLRTAITSAGPGEISTAARAVFADLQVADPTPSFAYRGLRPRRRRQGLEVLLAPAALAAEIQGSLQIGSVGRPLKRGDPPPAGDLLAAAALLPEPDVFDPSLDDCGSGVGLAWRVEDFDAVPLVRRSSGEIWVFRPDPSATAAVAIALEPEDEWWTASEIPWRDWTAGLRGELSRRGIRVLDYSSSLPQ